MNEILPATILALRDRGWARVNGWDIAHSDYHRGEFRVSRWDQDTARHEAYILPTVAAAVEYAQHGCF